MYLTFEEYKAYGGNIDTLPQYSLFEILARKKLDNWTLNRITDVTEDIKLCMYLIINSIEQNFTTGDEKEITGFSNDGISVSYEKKQPTDVDKDLYRKIVEILPIELISVVV